MVDVKEIKLLTWNLKDGLSDPERANALAEMIAEIDPDVAIFPEGAREGHSVMASAKKLLASQVGLVYETDYADFDNRLDRHRLVAVAKPEFGAPLALSSFGRNSYYFAPDKIPVQIVGMHGYDRDYNDVHYSDETRKRQIRHVLSRLALTIDSQAIVMGDLNSIHAGQVRARVLRTASPLFDMFPYANPGEEQNGLERVGNLSQRLGQIAIGGPLEELIKAGFRDADWHHHPTMQMGPFGLQLDHIMGKRVEMFDVSRHDPGGHSDHHGVSVRAGVFMRRRDES